MSTSPFSVIKIVNPLIKAKNLLLPAASMLLLLAGPARAELALRGDVDRDGAVTAADADLVTGAVNGTPLDRIQSLLADADGNGAVTAEDAALLRRQAGGSGADLGVVYIPNSRRRSAPRVASAANASYSLTSFSRDYSRKLPREWRKESNERPAAVASVDASVLDNETVFTWPQTGDRFARLRFTQDGSSVIVAGKVEPLNGRDGFRLSKIISRQLRDGRLGNTYAFFQNFLTERTVNVEVFTSDNRNGEYAARGTMQFKPLVHAFDPGVYGNANREVRLDSEFSSKASVGDTVEVSGRVLTDSGLRADAYVISPAGMPERAGLDASRTDDGGYGPRIRSGGSFRLKFRVEREGTYVVEINNYQGIAALNQPIYVGEGLPLIPNTLDYQSFPQRGASVDVSDARSRWIEIINRDRAAYGLQPVVLDERLSAAAQAHIDDMVSRNYFSHTGMDGSTPSVRAQRAGVSDATMVGENIGQGMQIEDLEAQLMASAAHRSNLLNPNWKRVGLGVGRYESGLLVGAQELGASAGEYNLSPQYFAGVDLDGQVPTGIRAGREVTLSGRITDRAQSVLVFFQNKQTGRFVTFQPSLRRDGRFTVDVRFDRGQSGAYLMGISLNGGASNAASVVVRA